MASQDVKCNLCHRVIDKSHEIYLFESRKGKFCAHSEAQTLDFEVANVSSHVCRQCVDKLKKRKNLIKQLEEIELFIRTKQEELTEDTSTDTVSTASEESQENAKKSVRLSSSLIKESTAVPLPDVGLSPVRKKRKLDFNDDAIADNCAFKKNSDQKQTTVSVHVEWPSKTADRKLPDELESLGKMLVRGTFKQIANAAWKSSKLRKELTDIFHKEAEKEVDGLCSKKNPSCLRKTEKTDIMELTMEKVADEIKERAPLFHSLLSVFCVNSKSRAKTPKKDFPAIAMAASICLRNRSKSMIAIQLSITTFLYHSSWTVSCDLVFTCVLTPKYLYILNKKLPARYIMFYK